MRKPQGYGVLTDPGSGTIEHDTFTCAHCQFIVGVKPQQDPTEMGGLCKMCMGLVCKKCNAKGTCTPWEKQMEVQEASYHARRSYDAASR